MVFSMKKIAKQVGLTRRPVITVCYFLISARPAGLSPKVLLKVLHIFLKYATGDSLIRAAFLIDQPM
jgi:hypothetical protein